MTQIEAISVTVRILDREYQVSCEPEEKQSLLESARYLDIKMKEIRGDRKVVGTDRIAVMAALNITHELLQAHDGSTNKNSVSSKQLANIHEKVEMALNRCKQTELAL